ncbi:nucleotidyltransferase family protein [Clostridium sp. C105KSO13]|uniref:nucleotidyltransferase family protein n=1 Tax=Clostridium sp. C105KSO13 TaxID=1776045 RepID=UPI0007407BA1|nr:sugar phosphate nucleotidyltransferase [Clostridium sp. C105KSO13]CUX42443.1 Nucleotidyl transferase [Clostridium sp. C105KSO13]
MKKPVLVIMAAGMGSRYGGLKQIDPVDEEGHIIMDFSIYDARRAGFEKVIFIIKEEHAEDFKKSIGDRISEFMEVEYIYQKLNSLPRGFEVPSGRVKPFGTGHAVLSCKDVIDGPFAVINADDYYGVSALQSVYQYLSVFEDDEKYRYAMVGYRLVNTLTENGYVSRGVCEIDEKAYLTGITERIHIEKTRKGAAYTEDEGNTWTDIDENSIVSMNMFGFTKSMLKELEERFSVFLEENLAQSPLKCEFFLPTVVGELIHEGKASVKVLQSEDKWYGITYKEDKQSVVDAVAKMKKQGIYPHHLWK